MIRQLLVFLSVLSFSNMLTCMDIVKQDNSTLFLEVSRKVKWGTFILPLLKECSIYEARDFLCSTLLISQLREQVNCVLFIRNVVKSLAERHDLADESVARMLNTHASRQYNVMGNAIFSLTCSGNFDYNPFKLIRELIEQGGDINFRKQGGGATPLMRAVYINSPNFVKFIIARDAKINMHDSFGRFARDYNLMYDSKRLPAVLFTMTQRMLEIETHNATQPDKIDWHKEMYMLLESIMLRHALWIDRILEQKKALSQVNSINNPLIRKLACNSKIRRALRYIIEADDHVIEQSVPIEIQPYLKPRNPRTIDRKKKDRYTA